MNKTIHILFFCTLVILWGNAAASGQRMQLPADEIVNPHWTGKHCHECHMAKDPLTQGPQLRFDGDTVLLCNRCHQQESVRTDMHPVNVELSDEMKAAPPERWPLHNGKVTCLTCHNAIIQMQKNVPFQKRNPKFIRGAPHRKLTDFCFSCHQQTVFEKINPHEQLDETGSIMAKRCLFCHQTFPDQHLADNSGRVPVRKERALICDGCHDDKTSAHPARKNHLQELPLSMRAPHNKKIRDNSGTDLPLHDETISCATCHNPHQKGVIKRTSAAFGAGELDFLRLPGGYELCIDCHNEKRKPEKTQKIIVPSNLLKQAPEAVMPHKPWAENKCKACHAVSPRHKDKPPDRTLCLQEGCHSAEMTENSFAHEKSVLDKCSGCHTGHGSGYQKLLRVNEVKLCFTCHRILQKDNNGGPAPRNKEAHGFFTAFVRANHIPQDNTCGICHRTGHLTRLETMDPDFCSDCHIFIKEILEKRAVRSEAYHQLPDLQPCSQCHNPHAAPYQYLLKEPLEMYAR